MKKIAILLFILSTITTVSFAQDFAYGSVSQQELDMKSYAPETSAHAVVLREYGIAKMGIVTDENIRLIFEYHVKIKIIDNKGVDNGTVEIPAYNYNEDADSYEKIEGITGITYFKDDNGVMQKIELDNSKIIFVKENNNQVTYKFAMPGIRPGCVIEYKYRKITPYWDDFNSWYFQGDIPKVYSEYEAHIPAYWRYNIALKGNLKLNKNTVGVEKKCLLINSGGGIEAQGADCSVFNYAMSDIPALVTEDYMTSPKNFLAAIKFELTDYTNPYTSVHYNETKDWKDIDLNLKKALYFGDQLKKKNLFKDRLVPVTTGRPDDLSKAKAIYAYIQQLFKWNGQFGIYSTDGISKAIENHKGNDADVNLSLVTALNAAGINANAVLLSTRDHGMINSLYPTINDFNYDIARVDIGGQTYLLDATDPLLGFGMLPFRCLNDKGRVFSLDKPSYFMDIDPPQKEKSTRTLDFTLLEDGRLRGTLIIYSTSYDGYKKRIAIKKFNTTDEYVEDFNSKSPRIKVLKAEVMNLDSLELPLIEKYDLEVNIADKIGAGGLAFNPFFWDKITENPFKLPERTYPVDLGMTSDQRLNLTMHLPPGYAVQSPPAVVALTMPGNGGQVTTNYESGDNSFTFSHIIRLAKPAYTPDDYLYLKELYNKIIQSEKSDLLIKKK